MVAVTCCNAELAQATELAHIAASALVGLCHHYNMHMQQTGHGWVACTLIAHGVPCMNTLRAVLAAVAAVIIHWDMASLHVHRARCSACPFVGKC